MDNERDYIATYQCVGGGATQNIVSLFGTENLKCVTVICVTCIIIFLIKELL
jgi:hypothetical protein